MAVIALRDRALGSIIDHYVDTRRSPDWPISLSMAVKSIRLISGYPNMSDRELAAVVATIAIAKRRNVSFDIETSTDAETGTA